MGTGSSSQQVRFQPDSGQSSLANLTLTLGSAASVSTVDIPNWANGFRLYPSGNIKFAVNRNPSTGTSTSASTSESALGVGGYARSNAWEVRILNPSPGSKLHLLAVAGGETVDIEFF